MSHVSGRIQRHWLDLYHDMAPTSGLQRTWRVLLSRTKWECYLHGFSGMNTVGPFNYYILRSSQPTPSSTTARSDLEGSGLPLMGGLVAVCIRCLKDQWNCIRKCFQHFGCFVEKISRRRAWNPKICHFIPQRCCIAWLGMPNDLITIFVFTLIWHDSI